MWLITILIQPHKYNASLRDWQSTTKNSITITITATTAVQWHWKRHTLTVSLFAALKHAMSLI
ncbi:hypothetical protein BSP75_04615 [Aeromonas sp. YN13HZO-058]|nr:hypothetical protein BSP75_04615 [Aeromonas sp. YN13HZO-058]